MSEQIELKQYSIEEYANVAIRLSCLAEQTKVSFNEICEAMTKFMVAYEKFARLTQESDEN
jgi:hypothetical protein